MTGGLDEQLAATMRAARVTAEELRDLELKLVREPADDAAAIALRRLERRPELVFARATFPFRCRALDVVAATRPALRTIAAALDADRRRSPEAYTLWPPP